MPYAVVEEKLKTIPEKYMEEVSEFLDFLLFKSKEESLIKTDLTKQLKKLKEVM